jgi:mRNA-degrading endonuclease RelE of RelBE toxin-antitoxin system
MAYQIRWDPAAEHERRGLRANQRALVEDGVRRHLTTDAERPSRARKPMRPNATAEWELRVPPLRVYYNVVGDLVYIVAVVRKDRATLLRDGREFRLDEEGG